MKFLKEKRAFTLIELIISLAVSSILFFIIFTFIVDSLEELNNSNSKTILVNDVLSFRNKLNRFIKGGYIDMSEVGTGEFNNLLLKDTYSTKGILYGVVDKNTMKLQKEYIYGENLLGYRLLSATEIINIEADNEEIYNMKFYLDKLYPGVKVKNFDIDFYNTGTILDLNLSVLYSFNYEYFGEYFSGIIIKSNEYVDFNLNF